MKFCLIQRDMYLLRLILVLMYWLDVIVGVPNVRLHIRVSVISVKMGFTWGWRFKTMVVVCPVGKIQIVIITVLGV